VAAPVNPNVIALVLFSSRFSAKRRAVYSVSSVPAERSVAAPSVRLLCLLGQHAKFKVSQTSSSVASNGGFRSKLSESGNGLCRKHLAQWPQRVAPLQSSRTGFGRAGGFARHRSPPSTIEVNSTTMALATKTTANPGSLEFRIFRSARAITSSSSGRAVTSGPASPGWFRARAA
jgi:hypothetical protein